METEPVGQEITTLVTKTRRLMHTPFPTPANARVGEEWWDSSEKRMTDVLIASCLYPFISLTIAGLRQFNDIKIIQLPRPDPNSTEPIQISKIETMYPVPEYLNRKLEILIEKGYLDVSLRIIPSLAWLRRTGLDELPQIHDVLKGRLALFGPRPPTKAEMAYIIERKYERPYVLFLDHLRNGLRLGVLSPYAIGGRKLIPDMRTRILLELLYADDASFAVEMNMLLHVAGAIMSQRGAY